jgi:hypothetical protein
MMRWPIACCLMLTVAPVNAADDTATPALSRVDHLVYAAPDLDRAVAQVEHLTGIRAVIGGSHPGGGTRNALISLGSSTYLEIIAPDPEQTDFEGRRIFRIDELKAPTLVTWAANAEDINRIAATDIGDGETPGASLAGSRRRPDGELLAWQYTDPSTVLLDGVVPFFINWADTPHPAASAPGGARLLSLRVEHPEADRVRRAFAALGLDVPVTPATAPALIAVIESPNGTVELR